jgi:hypothetical protein
VIERPLPGQPHSGKVLAAVQFHADDTPFFAGGTEGLFRRGHPLVRRVVQEALGGMWVCGMWYVVCGMWGRRQLWIMNSEFIIAPSPCSSAPTYHIPHTHIPTYPSEMRRILAPTLLSFSSMRS